MLLMSNRKLQGYIPVIPISLAQNVSYFYNLLTHFLILEFLLLFCTASWNLLLLSKRVPEDLEHPGVAATVSTSGSCSGSCCCYLGSGGV